MARKPIQLPLDALPHDAVIEWWYFNGHLTDKFGRKYAFMNCFFKADEKKVKLPFLKNPLRPEKYIHFAHSIVFDLSQKKIYKDVQPISLVSRDSFTQPLLFINYSDPLAMARGYVNYEIAETKPSNFHLKTGMLDLHLRSEKKPLLEGGNGYISVCGKKSYYYSLTDLSAKGFVNILGKQIEVKGKAWMDHQWSNTSYSKDKWTWFSLCLDNGTQIMCVEYDDGKKKDGLADFIDANGRTEHSKQLRLKHGKAMWKSKKTKAQYPMSWHIEIPESDAVFEVRSLLRDGELVSGKINYWEGPLDVRGTLRGKKVSGVGFMELVGYPADYNALVLTGKEIYKEISREIIKRW